jgi:thymidylate synthase ThyX
MIGKGNISAKIVADSVSPDGVRITTFELEYPRFIHAEMLTHRLFSRNAASSRAIPVAKAIELVQTNTAMPIHWGKNQPGMSAEEECNETVELLCQDVIKSDRLLPEYLCSETREDAWNIARDYAINVAESFNRSGYHKQIVNRLLEPFTMIKVVCTATEYDNFFWLRNHPDAQPEIAELARLMWKEYNKSKPFPLKANEWHVPYYKDGYWKPSNYGILPDDGGPFYTIDGDGGNSLDDALAISSSCCAQVSYRKLDDSLEKARDIFKRLVESKPVHASPFEHQATPLTYGMAGDIQIKGTTHFDNKGNAWSGNFRQWVQHRQLIPDHTCWEYKGEKK